MSGTQVCTTIRALLERIEDCLFDLDAEREAATHALLRLTLSQDICLARRQWDTWAGADCLFGDPFLVPTVPLKNAPDALRCAVAWTIKQPAFQAAKVICRKARATTRGAYLQLHVTEGPHEYKELAYLSTNADGSETKLLPGKAATCWPALMHDLLPDALITFGQEHLFYYDCSQLVKALLGPNHWPGVWRVPLAQAEALRGHLQALRPLLTSGMITDDVVPICDEKEALAPSTAP